MDKLPSLDKLKTALERELRRKDFGTFVSGVGLRRNFPKQFSGELIPIDNIYYIKELYKTAYLTSAEEAIRQAIVSSPRKSSIPVYEIAKTFESLYDFMFGGEHEGVYSGLLRKLKYEKNLDGISIPDLIIAAESMYLRGYKIIKKRGEYIVVTPDYEEYMYLRGAIGESSLDDFYKDSVTAVLSGIESPKKKKIAEFMLALPAPSEKLVFMPPTVKSSLISTLSEFLEKHELGEVLDGKIKDRYSRLVFAESKKKLVFFSYRGKEESNMWLMYADMLENVLLDFFVSEYGFMFVQPAPQVYIVGQDGYLITKVFLVNNRLAEDMIDYYPIDFNTLYEELFSTLDADYKKQLTRELSDYTLLKLSIGRNSVSKHDQKVDPTIKAIYNFHYAGKDSVFMSLWYKTGGEVPHSDGLHMYLDLTDFLEVVKEIKKTGKIPGEYERFFGGKLEVINDMDVIRRADKITLNNIPKYMFEMSPSFKINGGNILDGNVKIYEDTFSSIVDASGLPQNDVRTLQIKNRLTLFSLLARLL